MLRECRRDKGRIAELRETSRSRAASDYFPGNFPPHLQSVNHACFLVNAHRGTALRKLCARTARPGACATGAPTAPSPAGGGPAAARATTGPQPYDRVVTKAARSDSGMLVVHRIDNKVLFEVPDSMLGRDMLWLTRLAAAPEDLSPFTNAGSNLNEQLVRWERQGDRILLRSVSTRTSRIRRCRSPDRWRRTPLPRSSGRFRSRRRTRTRRQRSST